MKQKLLRKEYPKVRQVVKSGYTRYIVDLRRKHYQGPKFKWFSDRQTALKHAGEIGDKVSKDGLNSISVFTNEPRLQFWTEQCAVFNKTIDQAIETSVEVWNKEREVKESPYLSELLTVWVDDKTTNELKPLRPKSAKSIRNMSNIFKQDFGMTRLKEIDRERVESYLQGKDVSNQYRKNLKNYLGQFFNWSKRKGYCQVNPCEDIEITIRSGVPEFYNVEQCQHMLRVCAKTENKHMLAYFCLGLFAGIRPEEIERMTWVNIKLDTKEVYLPASITKTKKDRLFLMSDNLVEWLKTCDNDKPLVPESNVKNHRVKLTKQLPFTWIADGLRHTFSTFHYAKHKSLELLRHDMGNSPNVIERFYKGSIPSAEVELFWNIQPS